METISTVAASTPGLKPESPLVAAWPSPLAQESGLVSEAAMTLAMATAFVSVLAPESALELEWELAMQLALVLETELDGEWLSESVAVLAVLILPAIPPPPASMSILASQSAADFRLNPARTSRQLFLRSQRWFANVSPLVP
jgi:hypothetical protein